MYSKRTKLMVGYAMKTSRYDDISNLQERNADKNKVEDATNKAISTYEEIVSNNDKSPITEYIHEATEANIKSLRQRNTDESLHLTSNDLLFDPEDQDDDIRDSDYVPNYEKEVRFFDLPFVNEKANENTADQSNVQNKENKENHNKTVEEKVTTPKTIILKRARTVTQQITRNKAKHPILPTACLCKVKKCVTLFEERERRDIHECFWSMDGQKMWLYKYVTEVRAKRKIEGSRRNFSRTYKFPKLNKNGKEEQITVCQKYFLSTLGYKSTTVVDHLIKTSKDEHGTKISIPPLDKRGRHAPVNKKNRTPIKEHIKSFNPRPSHYRREHAPNRKYLTTELTIKGMHSDYNEKYPENKVSYEIYRQVLDDLNIGFYELEADKCGTCIELDMKNDEESRLKKEEHLEEAKRRRSLYTKDSTIKDPSVKVYAADMQKVFLLPRML